MKRLFRTKARRASQQKRQEKVYPLSVRKFLKNIPLAMANNIDRYARWGLVELWMYRMAKKCCPKCKKNIQKYIKDFKWKYDDSFFEP